MEADEQQAIVEQDVAEANKVAANVQVIKDDCQKVRQRGCLTVRCRALIFEIALYHEPITSSKFS